MPLTYQPFADDTQLAPLGNELRMNVSEAERAASGGLGVALLVLGLGRCGGASRWVLAAAGAALIHRAFTGRCLVYQRLEIDTRHARRGGAGGHGTRIERAVEIHCPADRLYRFWRKLDQLPRLLRHVESVEEINRRISHWRFRRPPGPALEWDAEIINDHEPRMIAWQSLPGATIGNSGSIWFEATARGTTRVKVVIEFAVPGGAAALKLAELVGQSPERELEEDLVRFKDFAERELASEMPEEN